MPRARPEAGDPGGAYPASRTGLDVSRGQGKRVALDNGWQVKTSAQRMSQSVSFRNTTDKNGVSVALGTSHAWTTLAGVRFSYPVAGIPSSWTPYVGDGLSYTWSGGRESGARRRRVCARQRGRGGARGGGRKRRRGRVGRGALSASQGSPRATWRPLAPSTCPMRNAGMASLPTRTVRAHRKL
jgi:hypothetical protein